jgi:hypothetical protein
MRDVDFPGVYIDKAVMYRGSIRSTGMTDWSGSVW